MEINTYSEAVELRNNPNVPLNEVITTTKMLVIELLNKDRYIETGSQFDENWYFKW